MSTPHVAPTFTRVLASERSAHQKVWVEQAILGEVWREQVQVVVSKLTQPRRMALKWRWFAKGDGQVHTLGRGTRSAMLLGAGFKTKDDAVAALLKALVLK